MSDPPSRDRFAVSRTLASAAGVGLGILIPLAVLLVAAAQVWTCFAPPSGARAAGDKRLQFSRPDSSVPAHQYIVSALNDVWHAVGHRDTFALVIVRSEEINAASMGSGRFLVWEGVASLPPWAARGIMAHEAAHDALRHSRKATELRDVAEFLARVTALFGGASDQDVDETVQRWASNAVLPHYSRAQEYQADSLGAAILGGMSYNGPQAMANTLDLLLVRYGNIEGGFFDYHPSVRERIVALRALPSGSR